MNDDLQIVWIAVGLFYLFLMYQNIRWVRKIKKLENEGDSSLWIEPDGISIAEAGKNEGSINVTRMFSSILLADSMGFVLAIVAAGVSAF
ncbi:MAG: hypothetical protein ABEI86_10090 [Halobacteriaceae archaeon]